MPAGWEAVKNDPDRKGPGFGHSVFYLHKPTGRKQWSRPRPRRPSRARRASMKAAAALGLLDSPLARGRGLGFAAARAVRRAAQALWISHAHDARFVG